MIGDPSSAPPRADLTYLRRRARPAAPRVEPAPAPATPAGIDYTRPGRRGSAASAPAAPPESAPAVPAAPVVPAGQAVPAGPAGGRPRIDFSRPDRHPVAPPAAPAAAAPAGPAARPQIDFSRPGQAPAPSSPAPSVGSLDLSAPAPPPAASGPARPRRPAPIQHRDQRVAAQEHVLLGPAQPTVTLTRAQSGIGTLMVEAVCSPEIGDLRLGALYQFRSGGSSTVQLDGGTRFAPSARRPLVVASHEDYERLGVDLRQVADLERIAIYAFSSSRATLTWGGTLVVTTFGGGRLELPLETLYPSAVAVLLSLYNLDGELVVRAELESINGDVREAARAYGYDRITWRDERTPVG